MAYSEIDPSRLEGDDLRRWYMRSPAEIEQDRQDAAAQRYQDFFGDNNDIGADPLPGDGPPSAEPGSDPVSSTDSGSATQDSDRGFTWVSDGPNRFRRIAISSAQGELTSGSRPAGQATQPANSAAHPRLAPISATAPQPGPSTPAPPPSRASAKPESAQTVANSRGFQSPFDMARDALNKFQNGPKISRPNLAESFIPVVGPAWEATADLQDGNYRGAVFNGAMAVADALPLGVAAKGINAARKGIGILKEGSVTADAARKVLRRVGMAKAGDEIHHTVALNGLGRNVQDWRNHYAFLKPLPQEIHRRLTGSWMGKPQFDPIRRIWYGTTDWQKAIPTGIAGYGADAWENLTHPFSSPANGASNPNDRP